MNKIVDVTKNEMNGSNNVVVPSAVKDPKHIGEGSYAQVFQYYDESNQQNFVIKKAKEDLTAEELERFKREFQQMAEFDCPYLAEVYRYDEENNEYIMESMDYNLDQYIRENNGMLSFEERKQIASEFLQGMKYIHDQGLLHGDITPRNVFIKKQDDTTVTKIGDFGLVRIPDTTIIEDNNEYKGYFTDPDLAAGSFDQYGTIHEIYAIGKVVYYIMTGKIALGNMREGKLKEFFKSSLHPDLRQRFTNVNDLVEYFGSIVSY